MLWIIYYKFLNRNLQKIIKFFLNYILIFEFFYDWLKTYDLKNGRFAHAFCILVLFKSFIFEVMTFIIYI